jgi:squalene synthase HpnC
MGNAIELEIAAGLPAGRVTLPEAEQYTRWLARNHYENFTVVSWMLPRELRQHFYNVYAYCRWADDLADEIPERDRALRLLDWWEEELSLCYVGRPRHPVFVALRRTVEEREIPREPFAELLIAFRQDQLVRRYPKFQDLLGYCRYSANPVGRLVLHVCGYSDAGRQSLSDSTCTALQLANFWQDVARDLDRDRLYIPIEELEAHALHEQDIFARRFDERFARLMKSLVERTRGMFEVGMGLAQVVDKRLRVDIELFSRSGMEILRAIERQGYDVFSRRPALGRLDKFRLSAGVLVKHLIASVASWRAQDRSVLSTQ